MAPLGFVYHIDVPNHQITPICLALPTSQGSGPLHLCIPPEPWDQALGSERKHKQGSSGLALSGTQDAGHRHSKSAEGGGTEVVCRLHSALQPGPRSPWLSTEASFFSLSALGSAFMEPLTIKKELTSGEGKGLGQGLATARDTLRA